MGKVGAMTRRVLLVEEHVLVALGLELALCERNWAVEVASGPTALEVIAHAQRFAPQIVLVDLHIGGSLGNGIDLVGPLAATGAKVVVLTSERRQMALAELVEAGAAGWINKGAMLDEVDATLTRVLEGGTVLGRADRAALLEKLRSQRAGTVVVNATFERLTQREALVLSALIDGQSAVEIARANFVSLATVRSQIRAVLLKLGVRSQLAAVAAASSHRGLLPADTQRDHDRRTTHPPRSIAAPVSIATPV